MIINETELMKMQVNVRWLVSTNQNTSLITYAILHYVIDGFNYLGFTISK